MSTVYVVFVLGQSNGAGLFTFSDDDDSGASVLANDLSGLLSESGIPPVAASELQAAVVSTGTTAKIQTANNVVVLNLALGASSVDGNAHGSPPPEQIWWYPDSDTPGALSLAAVEGMTSTINALRANYDDVRVKVVWSQGENDAKRIVDGYSDVATYEEATLEVFAYLRQQVDAEFPIYIDEIGSSEFVGTEARWNAGHPIVRAAQQKIAAEHEDIYIGAVSEDLPLKDRVHITDDSYEIVGARLANYIAYVDGLTDVITGPRPTPDPDQVIDPTDTPPQAVGESFTVEAGVVGATLTGNLMSNDSDIDQDELVVAQVAGSSGASAVYGAQASIAGIYGHLLIDRSGAFTYIVDQNTATRSIAEGEIGVETFTYIVSDGRSGRTAATLTINIVGANDNPIANNDVAIAAKTDTNPLAGNLITSPLGGDFDLDVGDGPPTVVGIASDGAFVAVTTAGTLATGAYGSITVHSDGGYSYIVDKNNPAVVGLAAGATLTDVFTYQISDGHGGFDQATLSVIIQTFPSDVASYGTPTISGTAIANNLRGTTGADIIAGFEGDDVLKGQAGNDIVIGGDGKDLIEGNDGDDILVGGLGADNLKGGNGSDTFVFNSIFDGVDLIQDLRAIDFVDVKALLDLPPGYSAIDAFLFGYLDLTQIGSDVAFTVDIDGAAGSISPVPVAIFAGVSLGGILTSQFIVSDAGTLPPDPGAAVATDDHFTIDETAGPLVRGNVLGGAAPDHDLEGSEFTVVAINGQIGAVGSFVTLPSGSQVKIDADGTLTFDTFGKFEFLPAGATATVSFTYSITDFFSRASTATVTMTIAGSNDKPSVLAPLTAVVSEGTQPLAVDLLAGAKDVDTGTVLSVSNVDGLVPGVTLSGTTLTVDPAAFAHLAQGEQQEILVGYHVVDEQGGFVPQTLAITVIGTNGAPVSQGPPIAGTPEDAAVLMIDLLEGASDPDDGTVLSIANLTGLTDGVTLSGVILQVDPAHEAFQSLAQGEQHVLSIEYDIVDDLGASVHRELTVLLTGTNDAPAVDAALTAQTTDKAALFTINLLDGASDAEGGVLSIADVEGLVPGLTLSGTILSVDPSAFTWLTPGEYHEITLGYRIVDEWGAFATQTLTVTFTGTNDTPVVAAPLLAGAAEDSAAFTLNLLAGASDSDASAQLSIANVSGIGDGLTLSGTDLIIDPRDAAFQYLAAGETRTLMVEYDVRDQFGASVRQTATITILGTDERLPGLAPPGTPMMRGTSNADFLRGLDGPADLLIGYGGNDSLKGQGGDDFLLGGAGNDELEGGTGNDVLNGGQGADTIRTGAGNDRIVFEFLADAGDTITDFSTADTLDVSQLLHLPTGMSGADAIAAGYLRLFQVGGNVRLEVDVDGSSGPGAAVVLATLQNKTLASLSPSQFLVSGQVVNHSPEAIDDSATLNTGISSSITGNVLLGPGGDSDSDPGDVLAVSSIGSSHVPVGSAGATIAGVYGSLSIQQDGSYIYSLSQSFIDAHHPEGEILSEEFVYMVSDSAGNSAVAQLSVSVISSSRPSVLIGTAANDTLRGNGAADLIIGGIGNDSLTGSLGDDLLLGGVGNDTLAGNEDNDTLVGGAGNDVLKGGAGADRFVFSADHGADVIDQLRADDTLVFATDMFASIQEVRDAIEVLPGGQLMLYTPDGGSIQFTGSTLSDFQHATILLQDLMLG